MGEHAAATGAPTHMLSARSAGTSNSAAISGALSCKSSQIVSRWSYASINCSCWMTCSAYETGREASKGRRVALSVQTWGCE